MNYGNVYEVEFEQPLQGGNSIGQMPMKVVAFTVGEAVTMAAGHSCGQASVVSVKLIMLGVFYG